MANTYVKIYLHVVFAVKYRGACIHPEWRGRLYAYIGKILESKGQCLLNIGGVADHVHMLFSYNAKTPLPDLMRDVKSNTTKFIKENGLTRQNFAWQKGYACFSYSRSQIGDVANYIDHQPEHHGRISLNNELKVMLDRFEVAYNEEYLFDELE